MNKHSWYGPLLVGLTFIIGSGLFSGCNLLSDEGDGAARMNVKFAMAPQHAAKATAESLTIEGSNGTLEITDVRLIVDKLKFEQEDATCELVEVEGEDDEDDDEDREDGDDGCEEVEVKPFFLDLPLTGQPVDVGAGRISEGLYSEFEFEVKDIDLDDEDEDEKADLQALATEIRTAFPTWPEDASMVIVGTFTPTGGTPQPFTTFIKAEIEVEMEFEPPIQVTPETVQAFTVEIDPRAWFLSPTGAVLDLSHYDYEQSHNLLEFEVKLKDGFTSLEVEDDDHDDEDDE